MIACRSCGTAFDGNFCTNCGTPAAPSPTSYCPRCHQSVAPGTAFCAFCGLALQASPYQGQNHHTLHQFLLNLHHLSKAMWANICLVHSVVLPQ